MVAAQESLPRLASRRRGGGGRCRGAAARGVRRGSCGGGACGLTRRPALATSSVEGLTVAPRDAVEEIRAVRPPGRPEMERGPARCQPLGRPEAERGPAAAAAQFR
jgi:hypothetical protein